MFMIFKLQKKKRILNFHDFQTNLILTKKYMIGNMQARLAVVGYKIRENSEFVEKCGGELPRTNVAMYNNLSLEYLIFVLM